VRENIETPAERTRKKIDYFALIVLLYVNRVQGYKITTGLIDKRWFSTPLTIVRNGTLQ
jgi:hypothetical protein